MLISCWELPEFFSALYLTLYYRLGEGCSHAAATLFKMEAAVRNGYTVDTSALCRWNQIFTTKVCYYLYGCNTQLCCLSTFSINQALLVK